MGQFLHFFPQYTLEDLESMPVDRFWYLMGAMLDNTSPDLTDPVADVASRRMREKVLAKQAEAEQARGRRPYRVPRRRR